MSRIFQKIRTAGERGIWGVTCGACGVVATLNGQDFGASVAQDVVPKKFRAMGWEVGKRDKDDRCPSCVAREQETRRRARLTVVEKEKPVAEQNLKEMALARIQAASPPREMSRDERRLIFAKLDEVYLDEKRGYDNGWSDRKVAEDLGVPRAWVSKLRDENFGPENTNPEAKALVAEVRAMLTRIEQEVAKVDDLRRRLTAIEKQF